jgi:exodeoxyribonuclease VII large subunit
MEQKLTLSELNEQVKETLAKAFPSTVWVIAEVSELKENRNGHCYLELIEKQGTEIVARSRATIWSYTYRMLKPYFETTTGQYFAQGIKILVQVSVEYHSSFGLSLNIKDIDPIYTVGDMAMQRKEIINRLQMQGVFEMNKELQLPLVPQKIAVISSATAAGFQDFMNQLENNDFGFKFYTKLFQSTMQGSDAVPSIINALERIYEHEDFFDVVVIIRGGGATADLSSFDNYDLAFNITQFPLPVITGIGHEKDDTIIDLVAHTRMKTPTAVAEFLIKGMERFYDRMLELENEIVQLTRNLIESHQKQLELAASNLDYAVAGFINKNQSQLTKKGNQLQRAIKQFSFQKEHELNRMNHNIKSKVLLWFAVSKNNLFQKRRNLKHAINQSMLKQRSVLGHYKDLLTGQARNMISMEQKRILFHENTARLINPENVLNRGYTLTLREGKIVKSTKQLNINVEIETRFTDGSILSKITKKDSNDN